MGGVRKNGFSVVDSPRGRDCNFLPSEAILPWPTEFLELKDKLPTIAGQYDKFYRYGKWPLYIVPVCMRQRRYTLRQHSALLRTLPHWLIPICVHKAISEALRMAGRRHCRGTTAEYS